MEDVKKVLDTVDSMQKSGATQAEVGRYAKSTGYDLPALAQAFKTYKETGEVDITGAGTSLLQGLTFGLSDEIGGVIDAATGGDYDAYVTKERNRMKLYQQQNPVISAAFEVAGSLPLMLVPGAAIAKGATGASKMATAMKAAAVSGAEGALYGFGTGEGTEGSLKNAVTTGALSGAVGAAVSPLTRAASSYKMSKALTPEQQAVEELGKRISPEAVDTLATPQFAQQAGTALVDTGDEAARYLRGIRGLDSQASQIIDETLDTRWRNQYSRVTKLIDEAFDSDPQLAKAMSGDLQQMKDSAGLAYKKLYTDFIDLKDPTVASIIRNDDMLRNNWDDAVKYALKESKDPAKTAALKSLPKAKDLTDSTPLPMEILDSVKKFVDDDIAVARRATDSRAAARQRALFSIKSEFVDNVDAATNGAYAKVRNNFAQPAQMEEALLLGKTAMAKKMSSEEIRQQLLQYSPQEAKAYMAGVLQDIYGTINNTGYSRDVLTTLIGTPEMTAKLKALMPNEAMWKRFKAAVENEARQVRSKRLVSGGSNTADKMEDIAKADSLLDDAVAIAFDPTLASVNAGVMARVTKFAQDFVKRITSNAETRSLQAKMLLETDPVKKKQLADKIIQARKDLAKRAEAASSKGASTASVIGGEAGVLGSEPEDQPLMIRVTEGRLQ